MFLWRGTAAVFYHKHIYFWAFDYVSGLFDLQKLLQSLMGKLVYELLVFVYEW